MAPRVIAARYELLDRLGSGGMATVWRARDRSLGREVAVKILHDNLAQDAIFAERFRREARHAASLGHHNVVSVYDTGEEDGTPYIVMELVDGRTLHAILARDGVLPVADTARIALGVLAALGHAHDRGLVHRDVKPGNVIVTPAGDVKVADFGIAKGLAEAAGLTQTGTLMGTASYLSPEQASGRQVTPASDLYAVGCVLHECLTGSPPFTGDTVAVAVKHQREPVQPLRSRRPDVPGAFEAVILRALDKDPARRFGSAAAMAAAIVETGLDRAAGDAPTLVAARAAPTVPMGRPGGATEVIPQPPPKPPRVSRLLRLAGIALLVAAVAWLGAFLLTSGIGEQPPSPTPEGTPAPTEAPAVVASPEPSPSPTPEPTTEPAAPRTPRPPRTPDTQPPIDLPGSGDGPPPSPSASPAETP